jgi:hypothetical protein
MHLLSIMTRKQRQILTEIFSRPERCQISWKEAERLLVAVGAKVREGGFSRARVELNGVRAVFQRPSADNGTSGYLRVALARFLREAKISLNEI